MPTPMVVDRLVELARELAARDPQMFRLFIKKVHESRVVEKKSPGET